MPDWPTALRQYVAELRRRRVFRTAAAYLVTGWLLVQLADATFEPLGLPLWSQRALIITIAAGLVPVCVLAWIFDIHAGRISRTSSAAPAAPTNGLAAMSPIASIAILPFTDLSQAHDHDWFCDGLSEEIIGALCCVRGLRVASRTASFRFRDSSVDPREIGRLLSVDAILEGSVRQAGDRLKIAAQLVDAHDGYHLWSESYERSLEDVFAIQGEIARNVAQALKLSLKGPAAAHFERYAPGNVQAYEYYLRGRQSAGQATVKSWRHATQMYHRAIELDPHYAQAHAGLADSLAQQILWRFEKAQDVLPEASAAASRALDLAPDLAEAHVAQGHIRSLAGDREGAIRSFERAITLNPGLYEAYYYFGRHYFANGDFANAATMYQAAFRTRPNEFVVLALAVGALDASGNHAAAASTARQAQAGLRFQIETEPENARLQSMAGMVSLRLGDVEAGRGFVEAALRLRPDDFGTLYNAACFYSLSGDSERALDLLEPGIRAGSGYLSWIEHDADLAPLRACARFRELMTTLK